MSGAASWSTYRHPTGGEMALPPGWQVTTTQLGLQLVPPDLAFTPQGPAEIYTVAVQPAPGIARPDDPRVLVYVDGALRKLLPTLGAPSAPVACGPGCTMKWSTQNLQTGGDVLAIAFLQIVDGAIAGIIAIGEKPRIDAREAVLQQVFLSFKQGEKQRDPALVGTWHHWSYRGGQQSMTSSESKTTMLLSVDGTAIEKSSHEGAGSFATGGYAAQSSKVRTGTWTAGGGMAYIMWSDNTSTVGAYQIGGAPPQRRMILAGLEWNEGPSAY